MKPKEQKYREQNLVGEIRSLFISIPVNSPRIHLLWLKSRFGVRLLAMRRTGCDANSGGINSFSDVFFAHDAH